MKLGGTQLYKEKQFVLAHWFGSSWPKIGQTLLPWALMMAVVVNSLQVGIS